MKWIDKLMFWRRQEPEGLKRATAALEELRAQAPEIRKLTHSLRTEREINQLGARLRLAMEARRDTK